MAAQFVEDLLLGLGPRAKMGYYNAAVLFLKSTGRGHRYINIEILRYADRERERYIYIYIQYAPQLFLSVFKPHEYYSYRYHRP